MNNTIDFNTAKTIDTMSKKIDHIDDTVSGFFSFIGVTETPRERELTAHIKKQNKVIQRFKDKLNSLIAELTETEIE